MNQNVLLHGFRLAPDAAPVACVDIGGTKVAVSIADAHGVRGRVTEPTAKEGAHDALALQIIRLIGQSCAASGVTPGDLSALGVASCGPFVLNQGLVELAAPNICGGLAGKARGLPNDWQTALLEAPLRQVFARVRVENDGIGALEAERRWGALQRNGQPMANCAYVTWSTGVGVGLCVDDHVLRGKNGNAGHAGHLFVSDNDDALCGCGNIGDVEGLIAGNAIPRRFGTLGYTDPAILFKAAYEGDTGATAIIDEFCRIMGRTLYNLIVTLDLERISLGGSVYWHHRALLLPKLQAHIHGKLPALTDGCELVSAGLGEQVGDFGALALVA
ncbi:MAG: ROK family protein [Gammaproteobacteria bacterium]|uniref:ROK family protein n=1 Tax=Rhodoferax sp. TaxID=50421 RepID=UPI0017B98895|nr:ROK family protein [Rhodoferax sp.]MBU3897824.1 ROK family protein [Gammaproteobacteria bacterium]MBA3059217.1 ROK family protein [Rhodoferax sp.]MBU3997300.1 ROK family protein [Gammaproteobacteria bacterium]MBU4017899.1 ROK family protein [Gammaproteobacteria bacterium]MBU4078646.1 ROK family protein [Gammaproteobacteria bacterium]